MPGKAANAAHKRRRLAAADFKKRKKKVGRKLAPTNATNVGFSARKVRVPGQHAAEQASEDAETNFKKQSLRELLVQCGHYSVQTRRDALMGIRSLVQQHPSVACREMGTLVQGVVGCMIDEDSQCRKNLLLLLCTVFETAASTIDQSTLPAQMLPFFAYFISHVVAAMSHLAHGVRRSSLDFFLLGLSFFPSLFRAHADKINPNLLGLLESYVHLSIASSSSSSSAHSNKNKQAQKNKGEAKKKDSTVMVLLRGVVEYMQAVAVTSKTPFSSSSGADASGAILTSTPAHTNTHTTETATQSGFGMHLASSSPSLSTYALSMRGVLVHRLPATLSLAHTQAQDMYISEFASKQWQAYVDKTSVKRAPKHQKHMRNHKQSHKTGNQSTIHTFTKMSMAHFSVQSVSYLLNMWQEAEPSMDLFNRSQASHSSYRNDERVGCMQRVLRALMLAFASLKAEVAREAQHTLGSEEAVSARLMNTYARHVHDHIAVCLPLHSSSSRGLDHQKLEELNQQMCELLGLFQHTPFFEQLAQAGRGQQVTSYLTQGLAKLDGYQHVTLPLLAQLLRLVAKHPGEGLKAAFHSYFTTQTLAQTPEKVALCLEAMVHMLEAENARTHVHAEHDAYAATWFASCVAHLSGLATVTPSHQHALARLLLRVLELCMPRIHQQQGGGVLRQLVLCVFDCTRGGNPLDTSVPGPVCTVLGASDQRRAFTLLANTREWSTELLRACVFAVRSNTLSLPVKQYVVRLLGHNESKCPPSTSNVWLSSLVSCLSSTDSYIASPALADEVVCALKQGEQVVQWGALCDGLEKNKQHAVAALIRTATQ